MSKQISATDAKNNFGGLLDDVQALGRVEILKHGRVVAVVLSPRELENRPVPVVTTENPRAAAGGWARTHMIPPELARRARVARRSSGFDED